MYYYRNICVAEDIEELLISNVKKRRELWDHKLPLSLRSRDKIATHWREISKELNGKFIIQLHVLCFKTYCFKKCKFLGILTPDAACRKWRYLKDSYMRIRNDLMKKRSGSAASKQVK